MIQVKLTLRIAKSEGNFRELKINRFGEGKGQIAEIIKGVEPPKIDYAKPWTDFEPLQVKRDRGELIYADLLNFYDELEKNYENDLSSIELYKVPQNGARPAGIGFVKPDSGFVQIVRMHNDDSSGRLLSICKLLNNQAFNDMGIKTWNSSNPNLIGIPGNYTKATLKVPPGVWMYYNEVDHSITFSLRSDLDVRNAYSNDNSLRKYSSGQELKVINPAVVVNSTVSVMNNNPGRAIVAISSSINRMNEAMAYGRQLEQSILKSIGDKMSNDVNRAVAAAAIASQQIADWKPPTMQSLGLW